MLRAEIAPVIVTLERALSPVDDDPAWAFLAITGSIDGIDPNQSFLRA